MQEFADSRVEPVRIKEAMAASGYGKHALHELDRWESKRTTGRASVGNQRGARICRMATVARMRRNRGCIVHHDRHPSALCGVGFTE
jgi:hypothetical protein